jgi:hypothetical protein
MTINENPSNTSVKPFASSPFDFCLVAQCFHRGSLESAMLVIRSEQMLVFEKMALAAFERSMVAHLREFSPPLTATLSEDELLNFVRFGISCAQQDGFTLQGPVGLYLETMLLLGSKFSEDPQYPWASIAIRNHEEGDEDELKRATRLWDYLMAYRASVNGPEDSHTLAALRRLEQFALSPISYRRDNLEDSLIADMANVYPQKLQYVGEPAVRALLRKGISTATLVGLGVDVRSIVLLCVLMFAFGHECVRDPLYPWIQRTLADPLITGQDARARRLETQAVTWLRHVNDYFGRSQQV